MEHTKILKVKGVAQ